MRGLLLAVIVVLVGCAEAQPLETFLSLFRGNTKRDYRHYTLEERAEYRINHSYQKSLQREQERAILQNIDKGVIVPSGTAVPKKSNAAVKN